jgi:hypothetical protein
MKKKLFSKMMAGFRHLGRLPPSHVRLLQSCKQVGSSEWGYVPGGRITIDDSDGFPITHVATYKLIKIKLIKKKRKI